MFRSSLCRIAGPLRRAAAAEATEGTTKLNFSLLLPHKPVYDQALVDQVTIPGKLGPARLALTRTGQPGVLEVHNDGDKSKFFVTGGFAFVQVPADIQQLAAYRPGQGDKAMVAAVDAVSVDDLDSAAVGGLSSPGLIEVQVEKGLQAAQATLAAASSDDDKAMAQVFGRAGLWPERGGKAAVDTHKAMQYALANN